MVPSDRAACPSGLRATNPARSASDIRRDDEDDEPFTAMISPNRCGRLLYFLWAGDLPPLYLQGHSLPLNYVKSACLEHSAPPPPLSRQGGATTRNFTYPLVRGGTQGTGVPLPPFQRLFLLSVSSIVSPPSHAPPPPPHICSRKCVLDDRRRRTHVWVASGRANSSSLPAGRRKEGSAGRSLQTRAITQSTNKICRFSGRENRWLQCHLLKHQLCSSSPAFSSRRFTYTTTTAAAHAHTHT